jgi:hypothetical protein
MFETVSSSPETAAGALLAQVFDFTEHPSGDKKWNEILYENLQAFC